MTRAAAPDPERAANVVGALVVALGDRLAESVQVASGQATTAATALSAMVHVLPPDPSVDLLRRVLGLTHSGTVRLVDRLEQAGQVRRGRGPDGRTSALRLTAAGRRAAARVVSSRAELLRDALTVLSPAEQEQFADLAGRVLADLRRDRSATRWTCRLCDTTACGRADGRCPVAGPDPPTWPSPAR